MKKLLILAILALSFNYNAQDIWQQRDSVNGPGKAVCGSFVLNGHGFVLGGLDDFGFKRKMYSYNMFQDDWDDEASIGGDNGDGLERGSATTFSIGYKGYVCLGQGETVAYLDDLWEYDLETESWSQKANFAGGPRKQAISFVIDNIAYVGTGQSISGLEKDFFKYDPTLNTWTQLNDFQGSARRQAVGFSMGGHGWLGTGDDGVLKKDFWMYNPAQDNWVQKADFPGTARAGAVSWATFPTAFIATGEDVNFEFKKDVWEYNYYGNSWIQRTDFPGNGRKNAIAFVIDDIAFVGTGYSGIFEDDFYAYFGIAGLNNLQVSFETSVYPNPVHSNCSILLPEHLQNQVKVSVYSIDGKDVTKKVLVGQNQNQIQFDFTEMNNGNYVYKLSVDNQFSTGKILVQK